MYHGGGGGGSRPPTAQQQPEMRYANSGSPRPPTRPYTPNSAAYQQQPQQQDPFYRPSTQGSAQLPPPSTGYSTASGFVDSGRRPSMPTPVYDRPSYSRGNSPASYNNYNDSQDDFHRGGYGGHAEETYPLTQYPMGSGPPGTPYDAFEGDTGHQYLPLNFLPLVIETLLNDPQQRLLLPTTPPVLSKSQRC